MHQVLYVPPTSTHWDSGPIPARPVGISTTFTVWAAEPNGFPVLHSRTGYRMSHHLGSLHTPQNNIITLYRSVFNKLTDFPMKTNSENMLN